MGQDSLLSFHSKMHERWKWCSHFVTSFGFSVSYSSRQMGQVSSSSDAANTFNCETSDFLGEAIKELAWVLLSVSSISSHVANVSKLPPPIVSPMDSESVEGGQPKTTSYGKGKGGARKVSGVDASRWKSTRSPVVNVEAVPLWDVKDSRSSRAGGQ